MDARLDAAIDQAFQLCPAVGRAAIGPYVVAVHAQSVDDLVRWLDPLIAVDDPQAVSAFAVAAVTGRPDLLADFIPASMAQSAVFESGRYVIVWQAAPSSLLFIFCRETRRGVMWAAEGPAPPWTYSRPFLPLFHAATLDSPWTPVHAAAIGRNGQFLALAGVSRAGKTTAALCCVRDGWTYAGDDFVLVNAATGEVAPIFTSARVRADAPPALRSLIEATSIATTHVEDQISYEMRLAPAGISIGGGRIAAWLLPKRLGSTLPVFQPARASVAFQSLILVTTLQLAFGRSELSAKILRMIGTARCYAVDTGTEPAAIPSAFDEFLMGLAS